MPFQIIRNDITKVKADAIVNTANPEPIYADGTDWAIYEAAGAETLLDARRKIGSISMGECMETPAFALDAKYIIHAVGPDYVDDISEAEAIVRKCYVNSLKLADKLDCESIAFPLLATGINGFSKSDSLKIAISVFSDFLMEHDMQITLVVFDKESFDITDKLFTGIDEYIDENYVDERLSEEYKNDFKGSVARKVDNSRRRSKFHERFFGSVPNKKMDSALAINEEANYAAMASIMAPPEASLDKARSLDDVVAHIADTWQESLFHIIDEKGYTDVEVYKRANVDRKLFSKIRSNKDYQPKKITAVAFALALQLTLDETKDFLGRAGYAFSPSSKFDLIIQYFINEEVYDTYTINLALFEHEEPLLGA